MRTFFDRLNAPSTVIASFATVVVMLVGTIWWAAALSGKVDNLATSLAEIRGKFDVLTIGSDGVRIESLSAEIQKIGKLEMRINEVAEFREKIGTVDTLSQNIQKVEHFTQNIERVEKLEQKMAVLAAIERNIDIIVDFDAFLTKSEKDQQAYERRIAGLEASIRNIVAEFPVETPAPSTVYPDDTQSSYSGRTFGLPAGTILLSTIPPDRFVSIVNQDSYTTGPWVPAQGQQVSSIRYTGLSGQNRLPNIVPIEQKSGYGVYYYVKIR